jgi:hypothetical protein
MSRLVVDLPPSGAERTTMTAVQGFGHVRDIILDNVMRGLQTLRNTQVS